MTQKRLTAEDDEETVAVYFESVCCSKNGTELYEAQIFLATPYEHENGWYADAKKPLAQCGHRHRDDSLALHRCGYRLLMKAVRGEI